MQKRQGLRDMEEAEGGQRLSEAIAVLGRLTAIVSERSLGQPDLKLKAIERTLEQSGVQLGQLVGVEGRSQLEVTREQLERAEGAKTELQLQVESLTRLVEDLKGENRLKEDKVVLLRGELEEKMQVVAVLKKRFPFRILSSVLPDGLVAVCFFGG